MLTFQADRWANIGAGHRMVTINWGEPFCRDSVELAHMQFNGFSFSNFLFSFKMTLGW
jgi:hypothetical protein